MANQDYYGKAPVAPANLTEIAKLLHRPDPLLNFKWIAETMPDLKAQGIAPLAASYVESVDIPFNNLKTGDQWYGGGGYTAFPGPHEISSTSFTFYEDTMGSTLKWIMAWKNLVKDFSTGFYKLPSVFKSSMRLLLMDVKNKPVIRVELQGMFPLDTGNLSLNYTDSGRIIMTQTFSLDDQKITSLM